MKLSTRMCYGTRALLELAGHYQQGPLPLGRICRTQDLSEKYLEQLMRPLKSSGLVEAIRGSRGGYQLTREPSEIRIGEVYTCLEGPVTTTECVQNSEICERSSSCAARSVWMEVHEAIMGIIDGVTLQDMLEGSMGNTMGQHNDKGE